ncbi:hypothetical protein [Sulfidibacter corallicola]|uniref:Uncharacterized protein n=1 Tax=Sulfidibacter corallicola TaxID=2818388 RepID=A0A8A4TKB9_SULCO|nr:hypothetical protein [Sulfidibacter corallicola]QTD49582.1 hypothetical protein J3U87_28680 [Sulfidibacter corallicola]
MTTPTSFSIAGAADHELRRSPAAAAVGRLAAASGLFLSHFEYRVAMPAPEHWLPADRPDLGSVRDWQAGVLPESKYQGFRNDVMIGSFHPGHRAKWTAHELCHGLVGFAWRPGASNLFHATAARLSELLPVALFYFFDEAGLRRCPDHAGAGPLFGRYCRACEEAAMQGPLERDPDAASWMAQGREFVTRELDAVTKTLRLGRPIARPWAALDLCSDGLAYAAAQARRLNSEAFARYVTQFHHPDRGRHADLDSLITRIETVMDWLCGTGSASPWPANPALWKVQDVAWRLFEVMEETEGELHGELDRALDRLAANPDETGLAEAIATYRALHEEYYMPDPEDVFAVGYPLPDGLGLSARQIEAGIASACPNAWHLLGEADADHRAAQVTAFAHAERPERRGIGLRFTDWLTRHHPGQAADLARFEAACVHAPQADAAVLTLEPEPGGSELALAPDVTLLQTTWPVLRHLEFTQIDMPSGVQTQPTIALRRDASGEVLVSQLEPHMAKALRVLEVSATSPADLALPPADLDALMTAKLIVPQRWTI